jgi:hypothetical protein
MTQTTKKKTVASTGPQGRDALAELADDVHESAKAGQHAATEALRKFRRTVDEAIPETVQPLRKTIVDAAIDFADRLVTAQYEFNRSIVRTADRVLSTSDDTKE